MTPTMQEGNTLSPLREDMSGVTDLMRGTIKAASSQDMRDKRPEDYDWREAIASAVASLRKHDLSEWELHMIERRVQNSIDQAAAQRKGLVEALEWYATGCGASDSIEAVARGDVDLARATEAFAEDCGDRARAALHPEGESETSEIEAISAGSIK